MMQVLRRLSFAALVTGVASCLPESAIAQSSDKTEPWETEWKVDRMTDAKTFIFSTDVRTGSGYYQLTLRCEPNDISIVLMAFTKDKEPRRITADFRATRRVHVRIDRHPALNVDFQSRDYYNKLQADLGMHANLHHDRPWLEVRRQFLASKSLLIGNVFPDEIFEVKTGFDQASIDACNQSSAPKTKSEDKSGAPTPLSRTTQRIVQACQAKWRRSESNCQCVGRTVQPWLQAEDNDEAAEILTLAFTLPAKEPDRSNGLAQLGQRLRRSDERGRDFSYRMQQAITAIGVECRQN